MKLFHICILSADNQPEYLGGVKRVTSILGSQWMKEGHYVCYYTSCNSSLHKPHVNHIPQFFLPKPDDIADDENSQALIQLINEKGINILLNPHVEDKDITMLAMKVRKTTGIKTVSALHFSPATKYHIVKESFFVHYAIGNKIKEWIKIALLWMRFLLYKGSQIKEEETLWLRKVIEETDRFIILSEHFKFYFEDANKKITAINNPINIISNNHNTPREKKVIWCGRLDLTGAKRVDRMLRIWKNCM